MREPTPQSDDQSERFLTGISYPATKADVIALADEHGASQAMIEALQAAQVESFASVDEARQALRQSEA